MLPVEMKVFKEDRAGVESQQLVSRVSNTDVLTQDTVRESAGPCALHDKRFGVLTAVNITTAVATFRGNLLPLSSG
jgi:hypothetical protein